MVTYKAFTRKYLGNNAIRQDTAFVAMVGFAVLGILSALTLYGVKLYGFEVPLRLTGLILVVSSLISYIEVGFKRFTAWSKLKRIGLMQKISLVASTLTLVAGIFMLFNYIPPIISNNAPDLLFVNSIFIFIEAIR